MADFRQMTVNDKGTRVRIKYRLTDSAAAFRHLNQQKDYMTQNDMNDAMHDVVEKFVRMWLKLHANNFDDDDFYIDGVEATRQIEGAAHDNDTSSIPHLSVDQGEV